MKRCTLSSLIASAILSTLAPSGLHAKEARSVHAFTGVLEVQYRTNSNIAIAPSSSERFDLAARSEFGADEDGEDGLDDGDFDDFDGLIDADPSEDEISEDGSFDADGDGIDDLVDPDSGVAADSESRFSTRAGVSHRYLFANRSVSWNNRLRVSMDTHRQRDALDKFNGVVSSGLAFAPKGSKHSFRPSLSYVALEKDNNRFSTTFIASVAYRYKASRRLGLGATYNYQDKDITSPSAPDARVDVLAFDADFAATGSDIFKLMFAPKVEDSIEFTRNSDAWAAELTYTRRLPWEMTVGFGYRIDSIDYVNLSPGRKDDNTTWGAQLNKAFGKRLALEIGYEARERESSLPGKDASNESVFIGGAWTF